METSRLIAEGRPREAEALGSEEIAARAEADPNSLVVLGVVYGRAGLDAAAADAFARAVARDPSLFAAQYNHGLALLRAGRQAEALPPLASAVESLPQSPDAGLAFSLAAVMNQKYTDAIVPLERLVRSPARAGNQRVPMLLATAYVRTGAPAKAVPLLRSAALQDPSAALMLVESLAASQDAAGALDAARAAAAQFPKHQGAQLALARKLTRAGRCQQARPAFEAALAARPRGRAATGTRAGLGELVAEVRRTRRITRSLPRRAYPPGYGVARTAGSRAQPGRNARARRSPPHLGAGPRSAFWRRSVARGALARLRAARRKGSGRA
ncbi:MAG: hypothetical protein FJW31_03160 [Acidobacteria bacterium]|nr:hypothetical protein [Acidobacteriota bacterium]